MIDVFEKELALINSVDIRDFVKRVIDQAPEYFWTIPSSSTGKYHPSDEHCEGGQVIHTKRVVKVADDLCDTFEIIGDDRDFVIAASIMHDFTKNGYPDDQSRTVSGHGPLWVNLVIKFMKPSDLSKSKVVTTIGRLIANHMGRWDIPYAVPNDRLELVVHMADYISSRDYIKVEV